jgi:hypothetical protein
MDRSGCCSFLENTEVTEASQMGQYRTIDFTAENKAMLLDILRSLDIMGPLENGYRGKDATEPYAIAHLLSSLAEVPNALAFPLKLLHREPPCDKPDFLLSMGARTIGIEHADARSENETRKDDLRIRKGMGPLVYFAVPVEPGEAPRSRKELRKEIIANDSKGGWGDPDNTAERWARVMLHFINLKEQKLSQYSRYDEDWLLIRDAWPFASVDPEKAAKHLFDRIRKRDTRLQFHRVFIISNENTGPIYDISEVTYYLYRRNDLWAESLL